MNGHNLFYYPYATFTNAQLPLLKVAALYFDKLYLLDPEKASWGAIGPAEGMPEVKMLEQEGILHRLAPEDVLRIYEKQITAEILADMADAKFLSACQTKGREGRWTLALAKVPKQIREKSQQIDAPMRRLLGEVPRQAAKQLEIYEDGGGYAEGGASWKNEKEQYQLSLAYQGLRETSAVFDEARILGENVREYRYADFPLSLGEAIMLNHALFAGLLQAAATPITDDPFHNRLLSLKLKRASRTPEIRNLQIERARNLQIKSDIIAVNTLKDKQLDLPILDPKIPLEEVLDYRRVHADALKQARDKLGWMARRIEAEPWTREFAEELEHRTIPDLAGQLNEARKTCDDWLRGQRKRLLLSATGIAAGAAVAALSLFAAPLTPVALATTGLGLVSSTAIPGAKWLMDWRDGKKASRENGLYYLLQVGKRRRRK